MFILTVLDNAGNTLWSEEFRTVASVYYRAPDAVCEIDNQFSTCVDDLVMAPYFKGWPVFSRGFGYAGT